MLKYIPLIPLIAGAIILADALYASITTSVSAVGSEKFQTALLFIILACVMKIMIDNKSK